MMDSNEPSTQHIRTPLPQRLSEFRRGPMILLIWIVAASTVGWMLMQRFERWQYVGVACSSHYEITTSVAGTIDTIYVKQFDLVKAGEVIAHLDSTHLEARIATAQARVDQLSAELDAARLQLDERSTNNKAGLVAELRRFQIDEVDLLLRAMTIKVELETDRILLERMSSKLARTRELVQWEAVATAEEEDLELESQEIARQIELNEQLYNTTMEKHAVARSRRESFENRISTRPDVEPQLKSLREAVRAENLRLQEIELSRRNLVLRSPIAGKVSEMHINVGQAILAGKPVATITEVESSGVICYLPPSPQQSPDIGARVIITRSTDHSVAAESIVTRIGPAVVELPENLWRDPATPEYGVPLLLSHVFDMNLIPGEPVNVRILK